MEVNRKTNEQIKYIQNKLGFTLIELLAVIVILAIIALIATPIVLSMINSSKESSQIQSAEFYLGAVENAIASSILNDKKLDNQSYDIMKNGNICIEYIENKCINELKIEISGEIPQDGLVTFKDGKIADVKLKYENKKVIVFDQNKKLVFLGSTPYQESENIEIPDLYNNTLTPVIYDGNNWIVADVTEKWYDYSKQEWANAVILNKKVKKNIGDKITVDGENPDALAMFIWIPRYEYKIEGTYGKGGISKTLPGEIEVNFINKNKKEATENYRIHPSFNFGGEDISGIWVGKFELSHTIKTSNLKCKTETCSESDSLRILPNVTSLRGNSVSSFFYAIRSMSKSENVFGINSSITNSHMMKNSEWGAVAYLSQSKYGKYGNSNYEQANKEIYTNNSSSMYTGRSGGSYGGNTPANAIYSNQTSETKQYNAYGYYTYDGYLLEYDTNKKSDKREMNKLASTTGNIYGVYDMSGGTMEYVMGVFANSDGEKWSQASGFIGKTGADGTNVDGLEWPEEKYYEVYKASSGTTISLTTGCNGGVCNGHALIETAGWYNDYADFINSSNSWFVRGGYYLSYTKMGIFSFRYEHGGGGALHSTRVVLTSTM